MRNFVKSFLFPQIDTFVFFLLWTANMVDYIDLFFNWNSLTSQDTSPWLSLFFHIAGHNLLAFCWWLPGASTGDPTHDKVMWRRPDRQGGSGLEGLPGPARASTLKPKSVCLLFTILCLSPTLLTLTGGYPRSPFSEENQLRALVNKSPGHERSISILTPLLAF